MPRQIVHQGRKIKVCLDTEERPTGETVRWDVILHPGAVVILPLVDREHVCLLKNYRRAIDQTLWEVPAGTLEPGEPIERAAERELIEETGYTATSWRNLGHFYPSPGVMDEKMHLFVAEGLVPGVARPEIDEQLEPVTIPWADAVRMCLDGTVCDLKTIAAILLWDRLR